MPIKPENKARYPANWNEIRAAILDRAGHACEKCKVPNGSHIVRGIGESADTFMDMDGYVFDADNGARLGRVRKPTIRMTQSELDRLRDEYNQTYSFYSGTPPAFEDWVHEKRSNQEAYKSKVLDAFDKLEREANRERADQRAEVERAAKDRI